MGQPCVSVVVPTRNRAALVTATLRSVLNQRDVDLEVIVVDDASTDETVAALARVSDDRLRVVRHSTQQGVSAARNTGISAADGRWLAFVDDDDLFAPDKLVSQLAALKASPGARWSCVGVVVVDFALRIIDWVEAPSTTDLSSQMLLYDAVPGGGSGVVVSRDLLDEVGYFDPDLSCEADWDMWLRLAQESSVATVARPLLAYRVHRSAMSSRVEDCDEDFELLCIKHADHFMAQGREPERLSRELGKAKIYLRGGQRRRAFQTVYALHKTGHWRRVIGLMALSIFPWSLQLNDARRRRKVPRKWRSDAETWLAAYR